MFFKTLDVFYYYGIIFKPNLANENNMFFCYHVAIKTEYMSEQTVFLHRHSIPTHSETIEWDQGKTTTKKSKKISSKKFRKVQSKFCHKRDTLLLVSFCSNLHKS